MLRIELSRYVLAGVLNTASGFLLFPIVHTIYPRDTVATLIACHVVIYLQAYVLAVYYVFPGSRPTVRNYALHNGMYWALFLVSLVVIPYCERHFGADPRVVFVAFAAVSIPLGFLWQKRVVFHA